MTNNELIKFLNSQLSELTASMEEDLIELSSASGKRKKNTAAKKQITETFYKITTIMLQLNKLAKLEEAEDPKITEQDLVILNNFLNKKTAK